MTGRVLTFDEVVEHVAFEAGKTPAEIVSSQRAFDTWLRRLAVWLAREVGGVSSREVSIGLDCRSDNAGQVYAVGKRLHREDAEFRRFAAIIACALGAA